MTEEQILALRPGDPLVAHELLSDADGVPEAVRTTPGVWSAAAIEHLRKRNGLPPLPDNDEDNDA